MTPQEALKQFFGYDSFRPGQAEIIDALMSGRDVLAILPTGGGKSLCYQIPAICMPGLALVISPLISLMKDQVDALAEAGVAARFINSATTREDFIETLRLARSGALDLLYVAPERLENENFRQTLESLGITMIAVDEAHCVSQWGHDFRPSYMRIAGFIETLGKRPIVAAFTATATAQVRADISAQLHLAAPFCHVASFDRANLYFAVQKPRDKKQAILDLLDEDASSIIYCGTRKNVEALYAFLADRRYPVTYYHAGLDAQTRARHQDDFIYDRKPIMVATNAFGMGIDKPDVRSVIHYNMPKDLESYYQEAGRAGRDGAPASATLLFSPQDIMLNAMHIRDSAAPNAQENLQTMVSYCNTGNCLRHFILHYFGEEPAWTRCDNCSICDGTMSVTDCTVEAQKILSCIARMGQRYGSGKVIEVLRGRETAFVKEHRYDRLSTYGIMENYSDGDIRDVISLLVAEGYLHLTGDYSVLKLTERSLALLHGEATMAINKPLGEARGRRLSQRVENILAYDETLYRKLRALCRSIAENLGVPPFHVFSERTLIDMAAKLPMSEEDMRAVSGVGEKKLARYGAPFLLAIKKYVEAQGIDVIAARRQNLSSAPKPRRESASVGPKRTTQERTLELIRQGLSPDAVARERKLSMQTIEGHITSLIEKGVQLPIDKWLSDADRALILQTAAAAKDTRLTPIKDALPDRISYFQIKVALALRNLHNQQK